MAKKFAIKFDCLFKHSEHRFYQKVFYKLKNSMGVLIWNSVLVSYESLLSNLFLLAPSLLISFFSKCRQNRSLLESFIALPVGYKI